MTYFELQLGVGGLEESQGVCEGEAALAVGGFLLEEVGVGES